MDLRRYELATVAAARRLRSSYCTLAHGSVLIDKLLDPETVRALVADRQTTALDSTDLAIMDFAEKVAIDATTVQQAASIVCDRSGSPMPTSSTSCSPPLRDASSAKL